MNHNLIEQTDTVCHYTSVASFLGMLESCSKKYPYLTMRATHGLFMNDSSEFRYGAKFLEPIIDDIENELMEPAEERIAGAIANNVLINIQSKLGDLLGVPFISSFTYAKENLPMWNMYAENGKGVMIVFDKNKVTTPEAFHVNCRYCANCEDIESHKDIYKKIYIHTKKYFLEGTRKRSEGIMLFTMGLSALLSPTIKHPAFKFEEEFRLAVYNKGQCMFREKRGVVIPYINNPIPVEAIKAIYIGPNADYELLRNSLEVLFANKGVKFNIKKSDIPYRG